MEVWYIVGWFWREVDNDYRESPQINLIFQCFDNFPSKHIATQMTALQ